MTQAFCPVELAQQLVRIDTCGGHEGDAADVLVPLLRGAGMQVGIVEMAPGRPSIIADLRPDVPGPARVFTGHLDTVPYAEDDWRFDPLGGAVEDGRVQGRGASDMKGGVAAVVAAAVAAAGDERCGPVRLVLTAGEETGCEGAKFLATSGVLEPAELLVVAEPTSNRVCVGHKGVLWLRLTMTGRAAHGSMPELGDNAVVKAARAILALDALGLDRDDAHPLLGRSTANVGFAHGGTDFNIVPARAEVGVDFRIAPPRESASLIGAIRDILGDAVDIEQVLDLPAVDTAPGDAWVRAVAALKDAAPGEVAPTGLPYFTDAAALSAPLGHPPVVIVGPGDPEHAHVADESCGVDNIRDATALYTRIMLAAPHERPSGNGR